MARLTLLGLCLAGCVRERCEENLSRVCTDCPTFEEARATALSAPYSRYEAQIYGCREPFRVVALVDSMDSVLIDYFDLSGRMIGRVTWGDGPRACGAYLIANEIQYGAAPECTPACRYEMQCPDGDCVEELAVLPTCPESDLLE